MLWGVARGVQHFDFDIPDHPVVVILDQDDIRLVGKLIFPVGITHVAEIDGRPGGGGQFATAADKVGVDVRLGNVGNP